MIQFIRCHLIRYVFDGSPCKTCDTRFRPNFQ